MYPKNSTENGASLIKVVHLTDKLSRSFSMGECPLSLEKTSMFLDNWIFELPDSRSAKMLNYPQSSNVGKDGVFVYRVNEVSVTDDFGRNIVPGSADMFFEQHEIVLKGFHKNIPAQTLSVGVVFLGNRWNNTIEARVQKSKESISGYFPFWGKAESLMVFTLLDKKI